MLDRITEKVPITIHPSAEIGSIAIANEIANLIRYRNQEGEKVVLGLTSGTSFITIFEELVRQHKESNLSFKDVIIFMIDEYYPIDKQDIRSHFSWLKSHLFDKVNIMPENIHCIDSSIDEKDVAEHCHRYEQEIEAVGNIDIMLLNIGLTGSIGFNEPGSQFFSKTRVVSLSEITIKDISCYFNNTNSIPTRGITMGVGTILRAKKILLTAWGDGKSAIVEKAAEEEISDYVPASFLQEHNNVDLVIDKEAASKLSRTKLPWLYNKCEWNRRMQRRAVIWLALKTKKSILKLTDKDYFDNHLGDLLESTEYKTSYDLNINIFNDLQHTITGWPGGKPNADDSQRPERALPYPKKVIVFSPHPDDDVISMGGTLCRLVRQDHDVHVAYQTSGHHAVYDDDVITFFDFIKINKEMLNLSDENIDIVNKLTDKLKYNVNKVEDKDIAKLKGYIRRGEASAACRYIGMKEENVHFLNLPFYEKTGTMEKEQISDEDINIVMNLLESVKPHQIYAAGDFDDPNGTHKTCFDVIVEAIRRIRQNGATWLNDCILWLYRGAWNDFYVYETDMAVPLSPDEVTTKRKAIFKHQTQKDVVAFPGSDSREFWQRAEERNRKTASIYDALGLADYQAIELFVKYNISDL